MIYSYINIEYDNTIYIIHIYIRITSKFSVGEVIKLH